MNNHSELVDAFGLLSKTITMHRLGRDAEASRSMEELMHFLIRLGIRPKCEEVTPRWNLWPIIVLAIGLLCAPAFAKERRDISGIVILNQSTNFVAVELGDEDDSFPKGVYGYDWILPTDGGGIALLIHPEITDRHITGHHGWIRFRTEDEEILVEHINWDHFEKWAWCSIVIYNNDDGSIAVSRIEKNSY